MKRLFPKTNVKRSSAQKAKRYRRIRSASTASSKSIISNGGVYQDLESEMSYEEEIRETAQKTQESLNSNFYSCVLLGINWWKFLRQIAPKIPKRINPELRKSLFDFDIQPLIEKFGASPTRNDIPAIEEFLNVDIYCLYGGNFSTMSISYRPNRLNVKLNLREMFASIPLKPTVVLHSERPFFDLLGTFFVVPTRNALEDFESQYLFVL